jgi:hypothetical protein
LLLAFVANQRVALSGKYFLFAEVGWRASANNLKPSIQKMLREKAAQRR